MSEQDRRQWYVAYLRSEEPPPSGDDRPIELFIIESSDEERALFPPCPGPLDEDEEELELDGEPAVGDVIEGTGNAISYAVCFRAGDISVNVNLDWGPQGSPPEMTDQMKEEALRVARSMVP